MPEVVPTSSDALKGAFRQFLANPTREGLFVHCIEEGVDLIVQVVGEGPVAYAAACNACGHRSRFERAPAQGGATCVLCKEPVTVVPPGRGEKHYAFAWRIAWAKDGVAGLGMGPTVEEGRFTDAEVLQGVADVHGVLRVYLPLFESLNVTTMREYRALTRLTAGAQEARVTVRDR